MQSYGKIKDITVLEPLKENGKVSALMFPRLMVIQLMK